MKKKFLFLALMVCTIVVAAMAYSRGDLVKCEDSCSKCKPNGPAAFTCGHCGKGFATYYVIESESTKEYDMVKFSHEGKHEYENCHHYIKARHYK